MTFFKTKMESGTSSLLWKENVKNWTIHLWTWIVWIAILDWFANKWSGKSYELIQRNALRHAYVDMKRFPSNQRFRNFLIWYGNFRKIWKLLTFANQREPFNRKFWEVNQIERKIAVVKLWKIWCTSWACPLYWKFWNPLFHSPIQIFGNSNRNFWLHEKDACWPLHINEIKGWCLNIGGKEGQEILLKGILVL